MTVSTSANRADYNGNGSTTSFGVPFLFLDPTHLQVLSTNVTTGASVTLALNSDYTVSGAGAAAGGTLTATVAPAAGTKLSILLAMPFVQATHYVPNDPFPAASHEAALDFLTLLTKQIAEQIGRTVQVPPGESGTSVVMPAAAVRANQLLSFDGSGNPIAVAPVAGTANALAIALASTIGATGIGTIYGTLAADLAAARPINRGGTGATTAGGALANLGLIDVNASVNVTGTTALALSSLGKCIVLGDSGTPVNYVVTLPAAAPVGSIIMLRIASTATKLYGINGNDANIDGVISRLLWAGEVVLLQRETSNWTKIGGKSRPLVGGIQRLTSQTGITPSTYTQVNFTSAFGDASGLNLAYNTGTGNISIPRPGNYQIEGNLSIAGTSIAGVGAQIALIQNSLVPAISPNATINAIVGTGAARFMAGVSGLFNCAAGDGIGMIGNMGGGTGLNFEFVSNSIAPTLTYQEVPTW